MKVETWQVFALSSAVLLGNLCGPSAAPAQSRSIAFVRLSVEEGRPPRCALAGLFGLADFSRTSISPLLDVGGHRSAG